MNTHLSYSLEYSLAYSIRSKILKYLILGLLFLSLQITNLKSQCNTVPNTETGICSALSECGLTSGTFDPDTGSARDIVRWNGTAFTVSSIGSGGFISRWRNMNSSSTCNNSDFIIAHVNDRGGTGSLQGNSAYILIHRSQIAGSGSDFQWNANGFDLNSLCSNDLKSLVVTQNTNLTNAQYDELVTTGFVMTNGTNQGFGPYLIDATENTNVNGWFSSDYVPFGFCGTLSLNNPTLGMADCDGDGISNEMECSNNSDPSNPCDPEVNAVACTDPCLDPNLYADNCDFDNDGVLNGDDIDDDNDGILDIEEGLVCSNLVSAEFSGTFGILASNTTRDLENPVLGYSYGQEGLGGLGPAGTYSVSTQQTTLVDLNQLANPNIRGNTTGTADDAFLAVNGNTTPNVVFYTETIPVTPNQSIEISFDAINWGANKSLFGGALILQEPVIALRVLDENNSLITQVQSSALPFGTTTWETVTTNSLNVGNTNEITVEFINITTDANGNDFLLDNLFIDSITPDCISLTDTDNDNIPNHFDLDSDNDGCSDAFEAGTTTVQTVNFQFSNTGTGANGFENTLENDDTASATYTGTYTYAQATDMLSVCPSSEICGNGIDDDLDGLTDCSDTDCSTPTITACNACDISNPSLDGAGKLFMAANTAYCFTTDMTISELIFAPGAKICIAPGVTVDVSVKFDLNAISNTDEIDFEILGTLTSNGSLDLRGIVDIVIETGGVLNISGNIN